jgi:hypothetical protein
MAADSSTSLQPQWTDPTDCPFCGTALPNPGVGFIDHVEEDEECAEAYEAWRERFGDDIRGGWSG